MSAKTQQTLKAEVDDKLPRLFPHADAMPRGHRFDGLR